MRCSSPATSVSARRHSPSSPARQKHPRPDTAGASAGASALLRRMTCGRWPTWRILGTAAPSRDLIVGVEWLRGASHRYAVATISPDGRALKWTPCSSSEEVIDLLERVPVPGSRREAA